MEWKEKEVEEVGEVKEGGAVGVVGGSEQWVAAWSGEFQRRVRRGRGDEGLNAPHRDIKKHRSGMTTERVEINPAVMLGKPVVRGTRITVELILRKLAEGATEGELRSRGGRFPRFKKYIFVLACFCGALSLVFSRLALADERAYFSLDNVNAGLVYYLA